MGPVRERLILLPPIFLATPAWAEVCDKVWEDWLPEQGSLGFLGEVWWQLTAMPVVWVVLFGLLAAAFLLRSTILSICATVLCAAWAGLYLWGESSEIMQLARDEGCVGPFASALALPGVVLMLSLVSMALAHQAKRHGES